MMRLLAILRGRIAGIMLMVGMLAAMATTLDACGRIGAPHQPARSDGYYRSYPSPDR
ncbi:hypothetical protein [Komagataeibacter saccharivorans]|uniref:hypothetical protein n=1 Tax=Komagataeibacter saccharivorans TaxID=265959 RepID=UPI0015E06D8D|nr:hypothetical protein [Komagataeibacter saccharivorans]